MQQRTITIVPGEEQALAKIFDAALAAGRLNVLNEVHYWNQKVASAPIEEVEDPVPPVEETEDAGA